MFEKIKSLAVLEQGQGMTEYGLVLGVIAVGVVSVLIALRTEILGIFTDFTTEVQNRPS